MGLINQDNRVKRDLTGTRTSEDVMRRLAKNVQITSDEVKGLTVEVRGKVDGKDIISTINQSAETVTIDASKIKLEGYTTINGGFSVDEHGNAFISQVTGRDNATIEISDNSNLTNALQTNIYPGIIELQNMHNINDSASNIEPQIRMFWSALGDTTTLGASGCYSPLFQQTSNEKFKKNFEKLKSGLDIIKDIDIYKYNLKNEIDECKKHIGFVIGDNYKYRKELTSDDNTRVDLYSFISVCCKAIQEQQEEIEELRKLVNK